jgi:DNA-binding LacI/PurR family transcriptional regulator
VPLLSEAGLPSLLINRQAKDLHTSSVNVDDTAATMDATEHLISLGHQNIAFIGGNKNFQNTKHRLLGYQIAMERHNLPLENDHILFGEFSEFSGYQQGKTILNMLHRPTAAICASDPLAIGCMRALTEGGLRLPDDFAVIGFGNIEASKYVTPSLSTVSQPSQEMGAIAAATLIQMLENPIILSQKVRLKTNLVLRDSSGSPIGSR